MSAIPEAVARIGQSSARIGGSLLTNMVETEATHG
jgi:hypothetical protein